MKKLLLIAMIAGLVLSNITEAAAKDLISQYQASVKENQAAINAEQAKGEKMAEAAKKKQDAMEKEVAALKDKVANVDSEEDMKKLAAEIKKLTAKLERTQRGNEHIAKNFEDQRVGYLLPKTEAYRKGAKKAMHSAIKELVALDGNLDLRTYLREKKSSKKKGAKQ